MKKKGFTLIELLAVIVILAIIALIIVPTISNVIDSARKAAAKTSAQGYIDAVKNRISLAILDKNPISGTNTVSDLESEVEYKGTRIERGVVTVTDDTLTEAKLCVNGYSFVYRNDKIDNSDINYCVDKSNIEISILGSASTQELNNQYSYDVDLSSYDLTTATNMVCNNNAVPSINENTLHIENIYGDTKCSIGNNLANTFTNLDDTTNNVVMLGNETLTTGIRVETGKDVILDLNGKTIETVNPSDPTESNTTYDVSYSVFQVYGNLIINATNSGNVTSYIGGEAIVVRPTGNVTINGGNFSGRRGFSNLGHAVINDGVFGDKNYEAVYVGENATMIINDGEFYGKSGIRTDKKCDIDIYGGSFNSTTGGAIVANSTPTINIYDGVFVSNTGYAILNSGAATINVTGGTFSSENATTIASASTSTGIINISNAKLYAVTSESNSTQYRVVISNTGAATININDNVYFENKATGDSSNKVIYNTSTGTININGSTAQFDENDNYISGIYFKSINGDVISNTGTGVINMNGGVYENAANTFSNLGNGTLNIRNVHINSSGIAIRNTALGTINICDSNINAVTRDITNGNSTGIVNYSNVTFSNGSTTPSNDNIYNPSGTVNALETCPITE